MGARFEDLKGRAKEAKAEIQAEVERQIIPLPVIGQQPTRR
jgi:hypothetical protein